jgi:hypothetical protein
MRALHGPAVANVATAHKLARIFNFMITRQVEFDQILQSEIDKRHSQKLLKNLEKKARQLGFQLVPTAVS